MRAESHRFPGPSWSAHHPDNQSLRDDIARRFRAALPGDGWSALRHGDAWRDGVFCATGLPDADPRPVSGGGQRASGSGNSDGGSLGASGCQSLDAGFGFDQPVIPGGYAWWYIDGLSHDLAHGLTIIGFVGSVFSPYYLRKHERSGADPEDHCAINVALSGGGKNRWAMTERGRRQVSRSANHLTVGPSSMHWEGDTLVIGLAEIGLPLPRRIIGSVRVTPEVTAKQGYMLNADGAHLWRPIAPKARIAVDFDRPRLRWQGMGYIDHNRGEAPIADGFRHWTWARTQTQNGPRILYDGIRRDGSAFALNLAFDSEGQVTPAPSPTMLPVKSGLWGIKRQVHADVGATPRLIETLVDAPFYARSVVETILSDETVTMMHESLDLDRLRQPLVRAMLPFRMPRRG